MGQWILEAVTLQAVSDSEGKRSVRDLQSLSSSEMTQPEGRINHRIPFIAYSPEVDNEE